MQSRRDFLLAAAGVSLGFLGVSRLQARGGGLGARAVYGPLQPDPRGFLDLPKGFGYSVISRIGDPMDDGLRVPGKPDGMAAFEAPGGLTVVVRNHEVSNFQPQEGPFGFDDALLSRVARDRVYDPGEEGGRPSYGGTTTFVYDTRSGTLERQYLSLAGTVRNCAGGPTPWGTWLSCEEDVTRRGQDGRARDHGYVFEVPATVEGALVEPRPITAMGRFNHEAVAVDPRTGAVYLTEDRGDGLLYRFLPAVPGDLLRGGRLQALAVVGEPKFDTRNWDRRTMSPRETRPVRWIDVEDIDAPADDLRSRGHDAGAARFARGEGIWWGNGTIYVVCTDGGRSRKGQVFRLDPATEDKAGQDRLTLFVEAGPGDALDMPDNATVAPSGDLFLCEDGSGENLVVGVTPEGELFPFARNAAGTSEFAGACFSPDGSTMFVNVQHTGETVAVTGPWRSA